MPAISPQCRKCGLPLVSDHDCIRDLRDHLGSAHLREEGLRRAALKSSPEARRWQRAKLISEIIEIPGSVEEIAAVHREWKIRPCGICGQVGWCIHREPEVDVEILRARKRRT
jgi:hypothetical protein